MDDDKKLDETFKKAMENITEHAKEEAERQKKTLVLYEQRTKVLDKIAEALIRIADNQLKHK